MNRLIAAITIILLAAGSEVFTETSTATEADVLALESSALAGNREAIQSLFNLFTRSDGAVSEYIDIVLGNVIPKHPKVFLEEFKRVNRKIRLDSLVGNTGPDLVDRFEEQFEELKSRKAALYTVRDATLIEVRNACLGELDRQIEVLSRIKGKSDPR